MTTQSCIDLPLLDGGLTIAWLRWTAYVECTTRFRSRFQVSLVLRGWIENVMQRFFSTVSTKPPLGTS